MTSQINKLKIEIDLLNELRNSSVLYLYSHICEILRKKESELMILSEMMLDNLSTNFGDKFDTSKIEDRKE